VIHFTCACGESLDVADESAGKQITCPGCGKVAIVPVRVPAGDVGQETTALPGSVPPRAAGDGPTDSLTCDLNATITPTGLALREEGQRRDRTDSQAEDAGETRRVGDYRILRELGQGGMLTVYEAEDIKLERHVSLKVMKPEFARNPQHRERFLHEARTAASVESVFICPIYEVGEESGVPFVAMPLLQGEPLHVRWQTGIRLAVDEVVRIGKEVAEGLIAAHEVGLVHRDIKPANIWLETQPTGPPRAIIVDFGLARAQDGNQQITQSGAIVGTPAYMSPEQARGNKDVDARTDLFSLGCVLYALCTGELPFQGAAMMDVLVALATHEPAPPQTILAAIPQPLSQLIVRLLAKNPDDRPTARQAAEELAAIERDVVKPAKGASTRIKPAPKSTRKLQAISKDADQTEILSASGAPSVTARKTSYVLYTVIALGLLGCVIPLVGGGIYYVVTDTGTIEIVTDDGDVQILLLKNGEQIEILDGASKKAWSVRTGAYTLRLKDDPDDLEILAPDSFELHRGGKHIVTIRKVAGLIERLLDADAPQFAALFPKLKDRGERDLQVLAAEIDKPLAGAQGDAKETLAKRQANAAVALLRMNQPEKVWPLLRHSVDPRVRSYLIHRLAPLGADAGTIVKQLDKESDPTIRSALLLSLGDFGEKEFTPADRNALLPKLQDMYRTVADPGLHAAAEWLLRQWQQEAWLAATDHVWARDKQQLKRLDEIEHELKETNTPAARWYVNGQGQTLVVVPGPLEFWMGSPPTEEGREGAIGGQELRHWQRIGRSFAIASKEVTVEQFRRFRKHHPLAERFAPSSNCPANMVSWYDAAAYCNWLSELEGIAPDQWCYEPNQAGKYDQGMKLAANYLQRTGYRLPTEAEWEYACRAGAGTRYFFGEAIELLPTYAWYQNNAQGRSWPVGSLKPNALGLFDMHGNAWEWCQGTKEPYRAAGDGKAIDDLEVVLELNHRSAFVHRSSGFENSALDMRSAHRQDDPPTLRFRTVGFRPVRTLPFRSLNHYDAARALALAAAEQGVDKPPRDDGAQAKLRRQAQGQLAAQLAHWQRVAAPRLFIARNLWNWQVNSDLGGIRDAAALATLPAEEQKVLRQFWADIAKEAEPANGERIEFARIALLVAAGQEDAGGFDDVGKAKLRGQALGWLKTALTKTADRAVKATIVAAAAPLPAVLEELAQSAPDDWQFQAELSRHFADHGNPQLAGAARSKASAVFEGKLAKEPENTALAAELADVLLIGTARWTVLRPTEMKSEGGSRFAVEPDGSILVSGNQAARETYTIVAPTPLSAITGMRLEALLHPSLPFGHAGRAPGNGNFALSELQTHVMRHAGGAPVQVHWADAFSDLETQPDRHYGGKHIHIRNVVDHDDSTYWECWPRGDMPHEAVLLPAIVLSTAPGDVLKFTLRFGPHNFHGLGHFRLSVSGYPATPEPAAVEREEQLFAVMKAADPWSKLAGAYALTGHTDEALQYFSKALQRTDVYTARQPILELAARFDDLLPVLAQRLPDDSQLQLALARKLAQRGQHFLAEKQPGKALAELEKSRAIFAQLRAKHPAPKWSVLTATELKSTAGETLTVEKDGSIFISGPNPDRAVYTLKVRTDLPTVTALRLETIPDPRLPDGGAGRAGNGNFHLSEFTAALVADKADGRATPLAISSALADTQIDDSPAKNAIDGNAETRWDTYPKIREGHWAVFGLQTPARMEGGSLSITVDSGIAPWRQHGLGRFRLLVTDEAEAALWAPLRNDYKDSEVADVMIALAKAHAQQGHTNEAMASFTEALALAVDRPGKGRIIAAAALLNGVLEKLDESVANDGLFQGELARHFALQGRTSVADAARKRASAWFEGRLANEPENAALAAELADLLLLDTSRWTVLTPTAMKSKGGATLTRLDDGSVLASGENPDHDSYSITARPGIRNIRAIRLEALPDVSLGMSGPGRNGNFLLGEMELVHQRSVAKISDAIATYEQDAVYTAEKTVDRNQGTGWGIWPKTGQAHTAYFLLTSSMSIADADTISVNLHFAGNVQHALGRFRIAVSDDPDAFARARRQLPALRTTNPWFTLAIAYAVAGNNDGALQYFGKVLEGADSYEARKAVLAHVVTFDQVSQALAKRYPADAQMQLALGRNLTARGKLALAAEKPADAVAAVKQAQDIFARLVAPGQAWTVLTPVEMKTENGSKLELQKDGTVFVSQPAKKDSYTLVFQSELKGIKGLRLEALADSRIPGGGPGWAGNGNFVLSQLSLQVASARSPSQSRSIALGNATADFSELIWGGWDIRGVVDGKGSRGWAIEPEFNKDHTAVFELAEEVGDGQAMRLTIRLDHQHPDEKYLLGRFRLSCTTDVATLPATRIRLDVKDGEVADLNLTLAKAHAQQGQIKEAIVAFARALKLVKDGAGKARIIAEAAPLPGMLEKLADAVAKDGRFQVDLAQHFTERGNQSLASAARTRARTAFEQQLAAEPENPAPALDLASLLFSTVKTGEQFWIDDKVPAGATQLGDTPWEWVSKPDHPVFRGQKATRRMAHGLSQHFFLGADRGLVIGHGAKLFAYVYLDPRDPPKTLMLQFNDGHWGHRAFWGEDLIPYGEGTGGDHLPMGPLPKAGEWVRLEVEAARVGLSAGAVLNGWAFTQHDGTCYWDAAGCTNCMTCFKSPWLTLAAAYAVTGEKDKAVQYANHALNDADGDEARKAIFEYVVTVDTVFDAFVKLHGAEPLLQLALARNLAARGKTALAAEKSAEALAALKLAQDVFTRLRAPRKGWTVLTPVEMKSQIDAKLELQKDGSIFAHQARPANNDTYTLTFESEWKGVTGLRLEVLADSRLPRGGPGWNNEGGEYDGNFVVNEVTLHAAPADSPDKARAIALRNPSADFSQDGWNVRQTLDGDSATGWGIVPEVNRDHTAVFELAESVGDGKTSRLTVRLNNGVSWGKYLPGRFRLSFTNDPATLRATRARLELQDSELVDLYADLGRAHFRQGEAEAAVAAFAQALALARDRAAKLKILGEIGPLKGMLEKLAECADNAERPTVAQAAYDQKRYALATRLWTEALANDPKLGDDRQTQPRYHAARAAALAAAGQAKDEPNLDDRAKGNLRGQALGWLKADLTAWTDLVESSAAGWSCARWVWDQANANTVEQTNDPRFLRRVFTLAAKPLTAELWVSVDNEYTVYVNGQEIGTGTEWSKVGRYDVARHLVAGKNVLAIRATNHGGVAGVLARLHVVTTERKELVVGTDDQTRVTQTANPKWLETDFDDRAWPNAMVLGHARMAPWSLADSDSKEEARVSLMVALWQWQQDGDLAGIRDQAALANLPSEEQKAFTHFWADIGKAAEAAAPTDNVDRLRLARVAYDLKKFAFAARLWAEALATDTKLGEDAQAQHRYNAARAAALAAAGQGKDEPPLDEAGKAKLRGQARAWLKAEVDARARAFRSGPPEDRPTIMAKLSAWHQDRDLAGVCDATALARIPVDEQKEWAALWARVPDVRTVVPTSKDEGQKWRYTTKQPADGWQNRDFDDMQWQQGVGSFGSKGGASVRTEWLTDDIWLRRAFTMPAGNWDELLLSINYDDGAEVYINGVLALKLPGWSAGSYVEMPLSAEARKALKPGTNVFAVHCHNHAGPQYIDVGIVAVKGNVGRLAQAQLAYDRQYFAIAAQLWAAALANDPILSDDRNAGHRYNAARAALAAAGYRGGGPPLDDAAKAKWRGQAFDWLKAELTVWTRLLEAGAPQNRPAVVQALSRWKRDGDLADVRDVESRAKLPANEQTKWQALWAEVDADVARAESLAIHALAQQPGDAPAASTLATVLRDRDNSGWRLITPAAVRSEEGATLTVQPDGSVVASGPSPDRDVYVIETDFQGRIGAIRLEVIPDPSMPAGGSGRAVSGNFVLTDVRVTAGESAITWSRAYADFSQGGISGRFSIADAIDADESTGWAIWPRVAVPHWAVFIPSRPITADGTVPLTIRLAFRSKNWPKNTLGRFRLSVAESEPLQHAEWFAALAPHARVGAAYLALGEAPRALDFMKKATSANPKSPAADWLVLALAHARLKETDEARNACGKAAELLKAHGGQDALRPLIREVVVAVGPRSPEAMALIAAAAGTTPPALIEAIQQNPDSARAHSDRAAWFVDRGLWQEGSADLTEAFRLEPNSLTGMRLGILLVQSGEIDRYRAHCHAMLERWASTTDNNAAVHTLKTIVLLPDSKADVTQLAQLADVAVSIDQTVSLYPWRLHAKGLHDYRTGKYVEALSLCRESRRRAPENTWERQALVSMDLVVEAMALYRSRDEAGARRALAEAKSTVEAHVPGIDVTGAPPDWLYAHILYREAEALIMGKKVD
jgi:serine/threonine protein kinase/formylglycine-generating enzyme required for sulfatase activity/tetratricopeptide (TPR) repeat protein